MEMPKTGFGWHELLKPPNSAELAKDMVPYYIWCKEQLGTKTIRACLRAISRSTGYHIRTPLSGTRSNVSPMVFHRPSVLGYFMTPP
jgi:hypothetical protein